MKEKLEQIFNKHHYGYSEYNKDEIIKELLVLYNVVGQSEQFKCYHENHEWRSDGDGGNLKYCNDCKCYV